MPRLNLGGFGNALPSAGDGGTPSPNSSRLGRPPLPPSARAGLAGTPRMSSRLGRLPSARSMERTPTPPSMLAEGKSGKADGPSFSIMVDARAAGAPGEARPTVPRLGLSGVSRSLGVSEQQAVQRGTGPAPAAVPRLALGALGSEQAGSGSRLSGPQLLAADTGGDSSDEEAERGEGRPGGAGGAARAASPNARGTPTPWLDLPEGFTFSGDLEEDLDRLEELEQASEVAGSSSLAGSSSDSSSLAHMSGSAEHGGKQGWSLGGRGSSGAWLL